MNTDFCQWSHVQATPEVNVWHEVTLQGERRPNEHLVVILLFVQMYTKPSNAKSLKGTLIPIPPPHTY